MTATDRIRTVTITRRKTDFASNIDLDLAVLHRCRLWTGAERLLRDHIERQTRKRLEAARIGP